MPIQPPDPLNPPRPGLSDASERLQDADGGASDTEASRKERDEMVAQQIVSRGVRDPAVIAAMQQVPRHLFVPPALGASAYADYPLPIGHGQTISQPFIVALMTELARPSRSDRALEIGTGSGYQAAVLSRVVNHVFSQEIDDDLRRQATERLHGLGYRNVTVSRGDGYAGLPSEAPFDIVVVTAAPPEVPQALVDQLAPGGRLVIPVGYEYSQELRVIEKQGDGRTQTRNVAPVAFVPMVHAGQVGEREE
jgi:protein-L-isoaspartate(D-aspartate) O-methyltransferase